MKNIRRLKKFSREELVEKLHSFLGLDIALAEWSVPGAFNAPFTGTTGVKGLKWTKGPDHTRCFTLAEFLGGHIGFDVSPDGELYGFGFSLGENPFKDWVTIMLNSATLEDRLSALPPLYPWKPGGRALAVYNNEIYEIEI